MVKFRKNKPPGCSWQISLLVSIAKVSLFTSSFNIIIMTGKTKGFIKSFTETWTSNILLEEWWVQCHSSSYLGARTQHARLFSLQLLFPILSLGFPFLPKLLPDRNVGKIIMKLCSFRAFLMISDKMNQEKNQTTKMIMFQSFDNCINKSFIIPELWFLISFRHKWHPWVLCPKAFIL